jgi:hypothetical protein
VQEAKTIACVHCEGLNAMEEGVQGAQSCWYSQVLVLMCSQCMLNMAETIVNEAIMWHGE